MRKGRGGWGWDHALLPQIGAKLGFLKAPIRPIVLSTFVTKGGVLKTTLTLNLARLLALHEIPTLVVGLDLQGDITTSLGQNPAEGVQDLSEALAAYDQVKGLYDYFENRAGLTDLILKTDLPALDLIPETPELMALDQALLTRARRENWLSEKVIAPLKQRYSVILIDCSPNWNNLITNALMCSDLVLSPVECRIHNFRNLQLFRSLLQQFESDMNHPLRQLFVPTRFQPQRKLSREIQHWYLQHLPNCLEHSIKENLQGEEASALHLSVPEYTPQSSAAQDMKAMVSELWNLTTSRRVEIRPSQLQEQQWPSL